MSYYKYLDIKCKSITPIFMYGNSKKAEIRASSIKGLLRYWWRVMNYEEDIRGLKDKENNIFGSMDKKAPVSIRVDRGRGVTTEFVKNLNMNKYLFYSVKMTEEDKSHKSYIKEGSQFIIKLIWSKNHENVVKGYLIALLALQIFGGIGTRARRGAGNFKIIDVNGNSNIKKAKELLMINPVNKENITELYKEKVQLFNNKKTNDIGKISNIVGRNFSIWVLKKKSKYITYDEALGKLETIYEEFRKNEKQNPYNLLEFGLPIRDNYKFIYYNDKKITRIPSNLIFKVIQLENKEYLPIIIRLSGGLPDNIQSFKYEDNINEQDKENVVDKFLEKFDKIL